MKSHIHTHTLEMNLKSEKFIFNNRARNNVVHLITEINLIIKMNQLHKTSANYNSAGTLLSLNRLPTCIDGSDLTTIVKMSLNSFYTNKL